MTYGQVGQGGSLAQQKRSSSSADGAAGGGQREQYACSRSSSVRRRRPQRLQIGREGCAGVVMACAHTVRGDVPVLYHPPAIAEWRVRIVEELEPISMRSAIEVSRRGRQETRARAEERSTLYSAILRMSQTTDFLPFVGQFSPGGAKTDLQKKESTMLPQAKATFAYALNPKSAICN